MRLVNAVPLWLTTTEAARLLNVNALTIRRRMMRGQLPAEEIDGVIKFKMTDLVQLVVATTDAADRSLTKEPPDTVRPTVSLCSLSTTNSVRGTRWD
jgi:excisionase family DNA binding protein